MNYTSVKAAFAFACMTVASAATASEAITMDRLSSYFQKMTTLESQFTQINSDGSIDTGQLYIDRPGKMRFDYDAPNDALVLASSGSFAIFDNGSNMGAEQYPLSKTPLSLILNRNVDLADSKFDTVSTVSDGVTSVIVSDPSRPEIGYMKLSFSDAPVALRSWVLINDMGEETSIILGDTTTGKRYPSSLFSITSEKNKREKNQK
jgi:outer membrane lipoprotein-sorting protein